MEMDAEIKAWLAMLIEEDRERSHDHLAWLAAHPDETDRALQIEESQRSIELGKRAAEALAAT